MSDTDTRTVEVSIALLNRINAALLSCESFFRRRDAMNAEIHLAVPRMSPITQLVIDRRAELVTDVLLALDIEATVSPEDLVDSGE